MKWGKGRVMEGGVKERERENVREEGEQRLWESLTFPVCVSFPTGVRSSGWGQ